MARFRAIAFVIFLLLLTVYSIGFSSKSGTDMSLNTFYVLANLLALSGWIALLVSVFLSEKVSFFASRSVPIALAAVYSVLMVSLLPFKGGGFDSLDNLASLFTQPEIALAGWIHYLVFDLFIGAWQVQTAKREELSKLLIIPALLLTMILGPLGLLFFLGTRFMVHYKSRSANQASPDTN